MHRVPFRTFFSIVYSSCPVLELWSIVITFIRLSEEWGDLMKYRLTYLESKEV
jgi:hypothetical protein